MITGPGGGGGLVLPLFDFLHCENAISAKISTGPAIFSKP
jgi:hypothetical protein